MTRTPPPAPLTRATLAAAVSTLARRDHALGGIVAAHGPPPLWARPAGFATLARIVLEQQVSLAAAATLYRRVAATLSGGWTPAAVLAVGAEGLRARGLTRQKARYVVEIAERIERGDLRLHLLRARSDEDAAAELTRVPGIGSWTAGIYLLMALRRPDVWPPGDLALHKAIAALRGLPRVPSSLEAARIAAEWAPHRAAAARILWHGYLAGRAP
ncbi:MAG: DNA-3-methyladenine glycosylase family protein [Gemmatimonadaceae bacterium]